MHPNPIFRQAEERRNLAFAQARGFGALSVNGPEGPLSAHVPFVLREVGEQVQVFAHLQRSNAVLRAMGEEGLPALLAVTGPDGFVSPDWYGIPDQVPTWNYIAVHLRGWVEQLPAEELHAHLEEVSAAFEGRLAKTPWTMDKMTKGVAERMMRMIVPVRLRVETIAGTWKLSQNKDAPARLGAAENIVGSVGSDLAALAALMRAPPA